MDQGEHISEAGFAVSVTGQGIAAVGGATLDPFVAAGGEATSGFGVALASGGGLVSLVGLGVRGLGGLLSFATGNGQPLWSSALQAAQSLAQGELHYPEGAPSPLTPITNALSGSNPCP